MAEPFYATFFARGNPRPTPRSRSKPGKLKGVYTPNTADDWKGDVIRAGAEHRPPRPLDGPVMVDVYFFLPRPKSLCRKKDPDGPLWAPIKLKDRDNLDKAVLDAMQDDGWFTNDGIVVFGLLAKLYHSKDGIPGARIRVVELGDGPPITDVTRQERDETAP